MRQHLSNFQHRVQSCEDTNRFAGEEEQTSSVQSPGVNSCGEPDEVCANSDEQERAGAINGEVKAEKTA